MIKPGDKLLEIFAQINSTPLQQPVEALALLRRPEFSYKLLEEISPSDLQLTDEMKEQVEIQIKYAGYIEKQLLQVEKMKRMEKKKIPGDVDYANIHGIAMEARQKLAEIKPLSIGQAARISGVTPADISILLVHIEHYNKVIAMRGS